MNLSTQTQKLTRRKFIAVAASAFAVPTIVPSSVFGANAPSNRLNLGIIGLGDRGPQHMRGDSSAVPAIIKMVDSSDRNVQIAALEAVGALGDSTHIDWLIQVINNRSTLRSAAIDAMIQLSDQRVDEIILTRMTQGDAPLRGTMVQVAIGRQVTGLKGRLFELAGDQDKTVRKVAYKGLKQLVTEDDFPKLLVLLQNAGDDADLRAVRLLSVSVIGSMKSPQTAGALIVKKMPSASVSVKATLISLLPYCGGSHALKTVSETLHSEDEILQDAAVKALANWRDASGKEILVQFLKQTKNQKHRTLVLRGVQRLASAKTTSVGDKLWLLEQLIKLTDDAAQRDWAKAQRTKTLEMDTGKLSLVPVSERSELRKRQLIQKANKGQSLKAYLDCGADKQDGQSGDVQLRLARGQAWTWGDSNQPDVLQKSVVFDSNAVVFEATGLDKNKSYQLGWTWWDYDGNGRSESVYLSGRAVLKSTQLPDYKRREQPPKQLSVVVPGATYRDGKLRIEFRKTGGTNAVVSELWIYESNEKPKMTSEKITAIKPLPNAKKILLITGEDYPGHRWKQTTPVLKRYISQDRRLAITVEDDLTKLSELKLDRYAAVVMHFKNYDPKVPGRKGFDNLTKYVENGGGLVLVHFACGAFQEFKDDFEKLVGRAWNPKLRGHDPYGKFTVNITDEKHPITKGMKSFDTTDELYTCLDGRTRINVLLDATSKIDRKVYPIGFVLNYGKGRVFHSVLGHDVAALDNDQVGELYRRATAWAAGLTSVPE